MSTGLDARSIEKCMGDPNADSEHPLLKEEQDAQVLFSFRLRMNLSFFIILCSPDLKIIYALCVGWERNKR